MRPLLISYPGLKEKLSHIDLGEFPTPVQKLDNLGRYLGNDDIYLKNDGLSAPVYCGNKVRKLEFLLAEALDEGAKEVLTFGFAGSNHATATAFYAEKIGIKSISMLMPQPNARYLRKNLLMSYRAGAELHQYPDKKFLALGTINEMIKHMVKRGQFPKIIPAGGSSPPGVAGFINAAMELKIQIREGLLPEPDKIYVPMGTGGTAVGLMIGVKLSELKTRIIPVRVIDSQYANEDIVCNLFNKTISFLREKDPTFPHLKISKEEIELKEGFFGQEYALFTQEGMNAVRLLDDKEGIKLDGAYTGKAFAGLLSDLKKGKLKDEVVVFWNTYNNRDLSHLISNIDYHDLPEVFHGYFEEDLQPLEI
ncbi:MAG: pyridoxal-phosphate dependent enzyme [Candidatus Eremiobacteraeota bacterium]|nr:pyridoxal-phosphate dependent enzyme [Candidatus Eremiobacteraeota bacterium]